MYRRNPGYLDATQWLILIMVIMILMESPSVGKKEQPAPPSGGVAPITTRIEAEEE